MESTPRAKVFISCGQRRYTQEVEVAYAIAEILVNLGFEPYIATQEQTLLGLKENIFNQLTNSEYFLFIDFLREQIGATSEHRGSLFSHQELAIASYLEIDVIAFQQKNVKLLDGMIGFLQLNAIQFDDPWDLTEKVRDQIKKKGWRADWKNKLSIKLGKHYDASAPNYEGTTLKAKFFPLIIENHNIRKMALNCCAYLESIKNLTTNVPINIRTTELKWAGSNLPAVPIMPKSYREVNAFYVLPMGSPAVAISYFNQPGTYEGPILEKGSYELIYNVISTNFSLVRIATELNIGNKHEVIEFNIRDA